MATSYLTPGVYVEEVSGGARPIQALGTSVAAFLGVAPDASKRPQEAVAINNWTEFCNQFVGKDSSSTPLSSAVHGWFLNGGGRCYVVNVGKDGTVAGGGKGGRKGVDLLEPIDDISIVAAPGFTDAASYDAVLTHCEELKDRVAILSSPEDVTNVGQLTDVATAGAPKPAAAGAAKPPADAPPAAAGKGLRARTSDGGYGSFFFPWMTIRDPLSPKDLIEVPPDGHVAGIYARTDTTRGVHKAPANEIVRGALDLGYRVTFDEQGLLNPKGVNCLRLFSQDGIRLYGARTLADAASEWRYTSVRRLFAMIEKSIAQGTRWVVFEPNAEPLWKSIIRDVSAFLTLLWRQGALKGATPEEAFFVKCDAETNPPDVVDAGQVVTVIGCAPVKPAEFVIFRIGQGAGGADVGEAKS
ncbi:MAG TPA: phage tail sheath C-terminal domain-containing protein [Planctomycetota bacterium]|nr:phage tail sheath C-terminal domain-containing protein [Planctomycetota bacterium]